MSCLFYSLKNSKYPRSKIINGLEYKSEFYTYLGHFTSVFAYDGALIDTYVYKQDLL